MNLLKLTLLLLLLLSLRCLGDQLVGSWELTLDDRAEAFELLILSRSEDLRYEAYLKGPNINQHFDLELFHDGRILLLPKDKTKSYYFEGWLLPEGRLHGLHIGEKILGWRAVRESN